MSFNNASLVIENGKLLLPEDKILSDGVIIVRNGKISQILTKDDYAQIKEKDLVDLEIIDAKGNYVSPGFIDPHTHISLFNKGVTAPIGNDANENPQPIAPFLRAMDAVYHNDKAFDDALSSGVTTVAVTPGSNNVIGGQVVALKTKPGTVLDKLIEECVAMKMSLGENPKMTHGPGRTPATRMGIAYLLRNCLVESGAYLERCKRFEEKKLGEPPKRDLGLEAMSLLLQRKISAKMHCHRADDIVTATRICKEFDIKYTLDHCTEGHLVAEYLGALEAQCIVGPIIAFNGKYEIVNRTEATAAILHKAGAKVSLTTDHPVVPIQHFLTQVEAVVSIGGLSLEGALQCITENAAAAMNLQHRVGRIAVGLDADLLIITARPGEGNCKVLTTIIDGTVVFRKQQQQ